jgi:hypothetical protein
MKITKKQQIINKMLENTVKNKNLPKWARDAACSKLEKNLAEQVKKSKNKK